MSRYITNRYIESVSFFKGNPTQSYVLIQIKNSDTKYLFIIRTMDDTIADFLNEGS